MSIRKNIFKFLFSFFLTLNCYGKVFHFISGEMAQNSSKSLDKFNSVYHLGLGLGKSFSAGTIELNPLILLDDRESKIVDGQVSNYSLKGYMIGAEYNRVINPLMTFGLGLYFENAQENYANPSTSLTIRDDKKKSFLGSMQLKIFLPSLRPFVRVQLGSKIHDYSLIIGTNLIGF